MDKTTLNPYSIADNLACSLSLLLALTSQKRQPTDLKSYSVFDDETSSSYEASEMLPQKQMRISVFLKNMISERLSPKTTLRGKSK